MDEAASPETTSDRVQGAAMAVFLAAGLALAFMALATPAARRQLEASLSWQAFVGGRTAAAVNRAMAHDLPVDGALREAGGVMRWRLFGSGGPQVWVGRQDWLYLMEELRPYPDAARTMAARVATLARLRTELQSRGIALLVAVVPDKARIVTAEMDGPRSAQAAARYDDLLRDLTASGIAFVDLRAAFAKAAPAESLYYRTDTHWSQAGAAVAARAIAAAVAVGIDRTHRFETRADADATPYAGDMLRLMSLERVPDGLAVPLRPPADLQRVERTTEPSPPPPSGGLLDDGPQVEVALVGSSYSVNANFAGSLAEALGAPVGNFAQAGGGFAGAARAYLAGETFRESPPKLIIWEIPERVMGQPAGADDRALDDLRLP